MQRSVTNPPTTLEYDVRVSARARRTSVRVHNDGRVEVVLPRRARHADAAAAVAELGPWIERRRRALADVHARVASAPGTVPYLGTMLHLVEQEGRVRVHRRGDELLVPAPPATGDALERWYRRAARDEIGWRLDAACAAVGRRYIRLSIRDPRTRWGSCSSAGAMSFSWRLLLAPEPVLDYVIWHEACHLLVMDHSPRFWALLGEHCPTYREPRRWLRANGAGLRLP